jgi:hypothetical protein
VLQRKEFDEEVGLVWPRHDDTAIIDRFPGEKQKPSVWAPFTSQVDFYFVCIVPILHTYYVVPYLVRSNMLHSFSFLFCVFLCCHLAGLIPRYLGPQTRPKPKMALS